MDEMILDKEKLEAMKRESKWTNAFILVVLSAISILMILGCITQFMSLNITSGVIYLFIGICMLVVGLKFIGSVS